MPRALLFFVLVTIAAVLGESAVPTELHAGGMANGIIRGRVDVRRTTTNSDRRPTVASLGAPPERERTIPTQSVVYLQSAPRGAFEQTDPGRAIMDQRNETFVPHVLAITTGTIVDFPNSDRIYHNVFSLSKPAKFDLGRYPVGRSRAIRFDRPGIVRVFCDIHSHMNAFVLVFNHPFFDITDVEGRFELPSLPSGTYTVVGWYEGEARITRSVVVPASGWAEVDLVVP